MQHSADNFERLLKEICADEEGDLLIESATKGIPKVFTVSTLVSIIPAQPFLFRNYQVLIIFYPMKILLSFTGHLLKDYGKLPFIFIDLDTK